MNRRPLVLIFLCLTFGILLSSDLGWTIPVGLAGGIITVLGGAALVLERRERKLATGLICLGLATLGAGLYSQARFPAERMYPILLELQKVRGKVASEVKSTSGGRSFQINPESYPGRIKVQDARVGRANGSLNYGDRVTVKGTFQRPPTFEDFNYRQYLRRKGVWGITIGAQVIKHSSSPGNPILTASFCLREKTLSRLRKILGGKSRLLAAIMYGRRESLNQPTLEQFEKTGLTHLLAASGLHLGILIGALWGLLRLFAVSKGAIYLMTLPLVGVYLFIVGFKVSLIRATLVYSLGGTAILLRDGGLILHEWRDFYQTLAFGAIVLVLVNPYCVFEVGFQLSFCGTFSILAFTKNIRTRMPDLGPNYVHSILAATMAAHLGILPILATNFSQIHPWTLLFNVLAIPYTTLVLCGGAIVQILSFPLLAGIEAWLLAGYRLLISHFSKIPLCKIELKATTDLWVTGYVAGLLWLKTTLERFEGEPKEKISHHRS